MDKTEAEKEKELKIKQLEHQVYILQTQLTMRSLHLDFLLHQSPVIFFSIASDNYFEYADGLGLKMIGLRPIDFVGRQVLEVCAARTPLVRGIKRAFGGEQFTMILEFKKGFYFNCSFTPFVMDNQIPRIYIVAYDVSTSKEEISYQYYPAAFLIAR